MKIAGPFETDLPMTLTVTGSTVAVALLNSGCQVRPPPPPLLPELGSVATLWNFQNPRVFRGAGRKKFQSSERTRELFQCATWTWAEHVFVFTVHYEGLGTRHPAVSLWAPTFHSTQLQLRSTRSCLIPFINPTWQITVLYIVWFPLGCHGFVQHTTALPVTALCYVCSEKVMICIDHC